MNKVLNSRIAQKVDSTTSWEQTNPTLLKGEIAFVQVGNIQDGENQIPIYCVKVGDGITPYNQLQYVAAPAIDVYGWAKQPNKPTYQANEIQGLTEAISNAIEESLSGGVEEESEPIIGLVYAYGSFYDQITYEVGGTVFLYWAQVSNESQYRVRVQWEASGVTTISDLDPGQNTGHIQVGGNSSPTVNKLQVIRIA